LKKKAEQDAKEREAEARKERQKAAAGKIDFKSWGRKEMNLIHYLLFFFSSYSRVKKRLRLQRRAVLFLAGLLDERIDGGNVGSPLGKIRALTILEGSAAINVPFQGPESTTSDSTFANRPSSTTASRTAFVSLPKSSFFTLTVLTTMRRFFTAGASLI
jgi:hypothetical protein